MEKHIEVDRSIIKKFRKTIWNRFIMAIKDYELIKEGDRIAVCISGGKDSMLMAKCIQRLQKYSDIPFTAIYLVMNPGYNIENYQLIEHNAKLLDIPITTFDSPIFNVVANADGSPCYLCARMRRGYLYNFARQLDCNKIALGHHFNDVIETTLMSMFYSAEMKTMMPKLKSKNFKGMELIRPMYMVKEDDIISWGKYNDLKFLQCACRFTEMNYSENGQGESKRLEMKNLVKQLINDNSNVDNNIFKSIHNVNLATIIGYRKHSGEDVISFLDNY